MFRTRPLRLHAAGERSRPGLRLRGRGRVTEGLVENRVPSPAARVPPPLVPASGTADAKKEEAMPETLDASGMAILPRCTVTRAQRGHGSDRLGSPPDPRIAPRTLWTFRNRRGRSSLAPGCNATLGFRQGPSTSDPTGTGPELREILTNATLASTCPSANVLSSLAWKGCGLYNVRFLEFSLKDRRS